MNGTTNSSIFDFRPEGWALDNDGNVTTDAAVAFDAGKLLPLGGDEKTSSYKGFNTQSKFIASIFPAKSIYCDAINIDKKNFFM